MSVDNDSDEDLELGYVFDEPIVNVGEAAGQGIECNGAPAEAVRMSAEWSCRCSQIKVAQPAQGDSRTGCCTQFTPGEMRAYDDSIRSMPDQGRLKYYNQNHSDFFGTISLKKKKKKKKPSNRAGSKVSFSAVPGQHRAPCGISCQKQRIHCQITVIVVVVFSKKKKKKKINVSMKSIGMIY